ncbi:MAG: lysylphosphatidylglycerol synthase transmembrane domain-containing protein [Rhodothermales bacterium]
MPEPRPNGSAPPAPDVAASADEAPPPPVFSLRRVFWPLLLSVSVLVVIGYFTFDPEEFRQLELMKRLNPWLAAAALGTLVLRVLFGGGRLAYVSNGRLDLMAGIRGQLAWDFFSNVTPSAVGGGPVAAFYVARDRGIPFGEATAFMLFSVLLDQFWFVLTVPLMLISAFYLDLFPGSIGLAGALTMIGYFVGMMTWSAFFAYAMLFRPVLLEQGADRLFRLRWLRRFHTRVMSEMGQLRHRAEALSRQPFRFFVNGFLLTMGGWISRYMLVVFIVWSVYPQLDVVLFFMRSVAMMLGSLILPTPGGSGGLEGFYVLFLGPPLMPQTLVAPTLLTWRILGYYLFIALGAVLPIYQARKAFRQRQAAQAAAPTPEVSVNGHAIRQTSETVENRE